MVQVLERPDYQEKQVVETDRHRHIYSLNTVAMANVIAST